MIQRLTQNLKLLSQKKPIIFSIMLVLSVLLLEPLIVKVFSFTDQVKYLPHIIGKIVPGLLIVMLIPFLLPNQKIGLGRKGFLKGIGLGSLFLIYCLINLNIPHLLKYGITMPPFLVVLELIVYSFAIGFCEEIMMRGLILNNFIDKWGNTQKGIYKSVLVSSFIFGAAHLVNLFYKPDLTIAIIAQIFYAITIGIFLASVYLRSKNMGTVIILHGLLDFASSFNYVFSNSVEAVADINLGNAIAINLALLPLLLVGLFMLRKVMPKSVET